MKSSILFPVLLAMAAPALFSCDYDPIDVSYNERQDSPFSLSDMAVIMAGLPLDATHLEEVHDAVSSSAGNGYDEEYMFSDLISCPGAGVGADAQSKAALATRSYSERPLRELLAEFLRSNPQIMPATKSAMSVEDCMTALSESDIQIYWPYSENWDGRSLPAITFDPVGDSGESVFKSGGLNDDVNIAYQLEVDSGGNLQAMPIYVDESYAMDNPVWVINTNNDAEYTPAQSVFVEESEVESAVAALKSGDEEELGSVMYLKSFQMDRHYDSWFGGASEFMIKIGAVDGFRATSEEDLAKYRPNVTDCMVVIKRKQLHLTVPVGMLLLTDYTPQMENIAFLITEDDGGKVESWKCEATVKVKSKSFGLAIEIPYRDRDDIVWRGQLSRRFFEDNAFKGVVLADFGGVKINFELR